MKVISERLYCGDRNRGCGDELSAADVEAGFCTQCREPLKPESFPLEHALLRSIREIQIQREAEAAT